MRFEYPALFEKHEDEIVVSFPDIPEALTSGNDWDEALREARDALGSALAGYVQEDRALPKPSPLTDGILITPTPLVATKLALRHRMRQEKLSNVALAKRIGVSETVVRRLLDPDHASKLSHLEKALKVLGQHIVVEVEDDRPAATA